MPRPRTFEINLEPTPLAPSVARQALNEWLAAVDCADETKAHVVLAASELVTNAVVHTQTPPKVVAMYDDGRLRLEVHDHDHTPPTLRTDGEELGGYGLRIVSQIADGWGWRPTPGGKQVWVETLC